MKEQVSLSEKVGYGFGDMASSMFWKIFGMYLLFFYTKVFGISPAAAGTMFLVTRVWDVVNDPMMGVIADRTRTRWGRYRPYLLWFAVPFAITGVLTFFTPDLSRSGKQIYAYATYTLMMMVYTAVNVPYASLLGAISSKPNERNSLASYRMFFAFIGSFITFMFLQPLIDFFAGGGSSNVTAASDATGVSTDPTGWTGAVAVIGLLCAVLFYFCFRLTRERVKTTNTDSRVGSVKKDIADILRCSPWWILIVSGLAALLFNAIRDSVALFYFADYVRITYKTPAFGWTIATIYLLIGQLGNMVGVALAAPLSNRFGKRITYMVAMLAAALLSVIFFSLQPNQLPLILTLQVLISICAGCVLPLLWSMYADISDYQELHTGRRTTGLIFASSSMSQKLGTAFGVSLAGWLLAGFGYMQDAAVQTEYAILGVKLMLSWLPAISCLIAAVAMFFYPLTDKRVKEIACELETLRNT